MISMPKLGKWARHPELLRDRSRNGVARAADLEAAGIDSKSIYRRSLPGGPWTRLLPGIILLHNNDPTPDQLVTAALLYAGANAMLTGAGSCLRHGLRAAQIPSGQGLHLLIPHERKIRSSGFVTIERTLRLPNQVTREGFPLAPLIRSTTDTVRRLYDSDQCTQVLIEAIQRGRCSPAALLRELNQGTQRGTAIPRRLLHEWTAIRSMAEAQAKELSLRLPNPPSHWNVDLYDHRGRYIGCPDAWWDDIGLAWEIDSFEFHFSRADYARTVRRNSRYAGTGILVVQTLPSQLSADPAGVLAEVDAAYRAALRSPRPEVRLDLAA